MLFYGLLQRINRGYLNLFPAGDEDDQGSQDEESDTGTDKEGTGTFAEKWGWIANVDAVSETCRCSWDDVWQMTAIEFLNIISYRRDKSEEEKRKLDEWKRTH